MFGRGSSAPTLPTPKLPLSRDPSEIAPAQSKPARRSHLIGSRPDWGGAPSRNPRAMRISQDLALIGEVRPYQTSPALRDRNTLYSSQTTIFSLLAYSKSLAKEPAYPRNRHLTIYFCRRKSPIYITAFCLNPAKLKPQGLRASARFITHCYILGAQQTFRNFLRTYASAGEKKDTHVRRKK